MPAPQSPRPPRFSVTKRAGDVNGAQVLRGKRGSSHADGGDTASAPISAARRSKLLTRIAAFYHRALSEAPEELARLKKAWGIHDASLFKTFQIGLANGSLLAVLPTDAQSVAELKALGVLTADGAEYLRDCVVFPLVNAEGVVVNLCGWRQNALQGNELYLPGGRQGLWNPNACRRSADLVITESVIDALIAIDRDISQCMPCLGLDELSEQHLAHLAHCGVARVVLVAGGAASSRASMHTIAAELRERNVAVASIALPEGESLYSYLTGAHAQDATRAFQVKVGEAFASLGTGEENAEPLRVSVPGELYERTPHGFRLALHGRSYEVKGIARERTQLKVTIKACGEPGKGFELTTLDLYSNRSREIYVKDCTALFGEPEASIKADIGRVIERAEAWAPEQVAPDPPESSPEDEARAAAFLANPDLFGEILADLETLGIAGEETNKLLCYLACVSRKLDDPLSLLIQSRSAAGKSTLQHAILSLCPEEDQVHYTRLTSQALYYQEETRLAHKVLALEETRGLGEAAYSLRALQSAKKLAVATTAKDPLTGRMKTEHYSVKGPVAVLLTTTAAVLDEETAPRFLTITIDESEAMTRTILASQRQGDTLAGHLAQLNRPAVIAKHQQAQRLLEPLLVVNGVGPHAACR